MRFEPEIPAEMCEEQCEQGKDTKRPKQVFEKVLVQIKTPTWGMIDDRWSMIERGLHLFEIYPDILLSEDLLCRFHEIIGHVAQPELGLPGFD